MFRITYVKEEQFADLSHYERIACLQLLTKLKHNDKNHIMTEQ